MTPVEKSRRGHVDHTKKKGEKEATHQMARVLFEKEREDSGGVENKEEKTWEFWLHERPFSVLLFDVQDSRLAVVQVMARAGEETGGSGRESGPRVGGRTCRWRASLDGTLGAADE